MTLFALIGIALEVAGFLLIIKSTKKLDYKPGDYVGPEYVDPKTDKPPPHIESSPIPLRYRPGIYAVTVGLGLQFVDIVVTQVLKYPY